MQYCPGTLQYFPAGVCAAVGDRHGSTGCDALFQWEYMGGYFDPVLLFLARGMVIL